MLTDQEIEARVAECGLTGPWPTVLESLHRGEIVIIVACEGKTRWVFDYKPEWKETLGYYFPKVEQT